MEFFRTSRYSENCWPSTPPPVLASIVNPAFSSRVITCTEFSLQYPFRGKRIICRPSSWFHAAFERASNTAWLVSGKTSSNNERSADIMMRSPRSGEIWSATISYKSVSDAWCKSLVLPIGGCGDVGPTTAADKLLRSRSFFICSSCLIMAVDKALEHN